MDAQGKFDKFPSMDDNCLKGSFSFVMAFIAELNLKILGGLYKNL